MIVMIDLCDISNGINNARSNKSHYPTSPNTAAAWKNVRPKCDKIIENDEASESPGEVMHEKKHESFVRLFLPKHPATHREHELMRLLAVDM